MCLSDGSRILLAITLVVSIPGCGNDRRNSAPDSHSFFQTGIRPAWTYISPGYEIYQPSFSPDGKYLAFVRRLHEPDGHEAEQMSEASQNALDQQIALDPRYADPKILVCRVGDDSVVFVDWGWNPDFSADGRSIVYARQQSPISGKRVLAATLLGNPVALYNRLTGDSFSIAASESTYFYSPKFQPDGRTVVSAIEGATNGAYGSSVGCVDIDVATHRVSELLQPSDSHGLPSLVEIYSTRSGFTLAIQHTPIQPGKFVADKYSSRLVSLTPIARTVLDFGICDHAALPTIIGEWHTGELIVQSSGAGRIAVTTAALKTRPFSEIPVSSKPDICPVAPHWIDLESQTLYVYESAKGNHSEYRLPGRLADVAWSADGSQLALVVTRFKDSDDIYFAYDELVVLDIPSLKK